MGMADPTTSRTPSVIWHPMLKHQNVDLPIREKVDMVLDDGFGTRAIIVRQLGEGGSMALWHQQKVRISERAK